MANGIMEVTSFIIYVHTFIHTQKDTWTEHRSDKHRQHINYMYTLKISTTEKPENGKQNELHDLLINIYVHKM